VIKLVDQAFEQKKITFSVDLGGKMAVDKSLPVNAEVFSSKHLWSIVQHKPTDYEPYGYRKRDDLDCSCGCKYFLTLPGDLGMDWGVCTNPISPRCGLLTFEHMGCPFFESGDEELENENGV
jgi:hypothetical protein